MSAGEETLRLVHGTVDLGSGEVSVGDASARLTPNERALLRFLVEAGGDWVERQALLTDVWGYAPTAKSRTVYTTTQRLRAKIEPDPSVPVHIETDGSRYRFVAAPAPTLVTRPHADLDAFFGRGDELAHLDALEASGTRLITLTGPGGVGKSRLSVRWGRERETTVVMLASLSPGEDPWWAIASALGLERVSRDEAWFAAVERRVAGWLVLDNAEHLLESTSAMVAELLSSTSLRVLVTSRQGLGIAGGAVVRLGAISSQDARQMLRARLHESISPADEEALLGMLDGHPLAIELAASTLDHVDLPTLLTRVHEIAAPGEDHRHASLNQCLQHSWSALPEDERTALRSLAVFRSAIPMDAAEAMAAPSVLANLRRRSWLVRDRRAGTLALLMPIRQWLVERHGIVESARLVQARWISEQLPEAGRNLSTDLRRVALALDAIEASDAVRYSHGELAARCLLVAGIHGQYGAPLGPVLRRIDGILRGQGSVEVFLRLLALRAGERIRQGRREEAKADLDRCETLASTEAERMLLVAEWALYDRSAGEWQRTVERAERAVEHAPTPALRVVALRILGNAYLPTDRARARAVYGQALQLAKEQGERLEQARCLGALARSGSLEEQEACHRDARAAAALYREEGHERFAVMAMMTLGYISTMLGRHREAIRQLRQLAESPYAMDNLHQQTAVHGMIAEAALMGGDLELAESTIGQAIVFASESKHVTLRWATHGLYAEIVGALGDDGTGMLRDAMRELEAVGNRAEVSIVMLRLARQLALRGEAEESRALLARSEALVGEFPRAHWVQHRNDVVRILEES